MQFFMCKPTICLGLDAVDLSFVSPMLRRRLAEIEKISLYLLNSSAPAINEYRCVFASQWGEIRRTAKLLTQLAKMEEMSPLDFSSSVHNASIGLFSLLKKNKESYTALSAEEDSLEMGILETLVTPSPVLFVFVEESVPDIYKNHFKESELSSCKAEGLSFFLSKEEDLSSDQCFKVNIEFEKHNAPILSFETMQRFLEGKESKIITKNFQISR